MRLSPSSTGKTRTVVLLLVVLAAVGGGWWYWKQKTAPQISYQTSPVTRGKIVQTVTATGTINPVINVQVGSQISGIIKHLYADFNSPVKAGQVVAQIDPATYEATVIQAEGELANAEAALELARLNAQRVRELAARKAAPQSALDQAEATLRQAEAQVKIRQGALARARVDLARCTIYSPVDGIVISRNVDVGQTVAASLQAPVIFTIANDLSKMQINANVAEADVGKVEEGQDVTFTVDAFPTRTFHGKVSQVRNAATTVSNVVSYDVVIDVNNDDLKLKPGMTATVSIIVDQREETLRIPAAALRFRLPEELLPKKDETGPSGEAQGKPIASGGGERRSRGEGRRDGRRQQTADGSVQTRTVYILKDGKPEAVRIKTGISDGLNTEVVEGLKEGDLAITAILGAPGNAQRGGSGPGGGARNPFMPQRPPGPRGIR